MIYFNLLIIFLIIIFIHEFGHYIIARLFKVTVTDFSIGFGKVLYKFTDRNKTKWKFSLIPLGGYVKIKGLESIFRNIQTDKDDLNSFKNINLSKKISILLAGSLFNIISAWLILFLLLFFLGIPTYSPIIGKVFDETPAAINDLQKDDRIISINDKLINNFGDISKIIKKSKSIKIEILRKDDILVKEFDLLFDDNQNRFIIGISSNSIPEIKRYLFFQSLIESFSFIPTYYIETYKYMVNAYSQKTLANEMAGPIGIVKMADKLMLDQIKGIIIIFISISLFVGLFNLLPIPLLDGGHIIYFIFQSVFSNSLPPLITRIYLTLGIFIISLLFLVITYNDIFYK